MTLSVDSQDGIYGLSIHIDSHSHPQIFVLGVNLFLPSR